MSKVKRKNRLFAIRQCTEKSQAVKVAMATHTEGKRPQRRNKTDHVHIGKSKPHTTSITQVNHCCGNCDRAQLARRRALVKESAGDGGGQSRVVVWCSVSTEPSVRRQIPTEH